MKKITGILCVAFALVLMMSGCGTKEEETTSTTYAQPAVTTPQLAADVPASLRSFYSDELPNLTFKSGIKALDDSEITCDYSMLKKTVTADYDNDGVKELVLDYDIREKANKRSMDVVVFLDEQNGEPVVAATHTGSYGASSDGETNILSLYNGQVCKVRFIKKSAYEVVLIDYFENGAWTTKVTAYKHISDHDKVKLDHGSCYVDHSGEELYRAAMGEVHYSKEKFLNFRTPDENYNTLITGLLADTMLP